MGIMWDQMAGPSGTPRNLYIEGHGALFFLSVNYPLVAPAAKSADNEAKDAPDNEWEEARRELNQGTMSRRLVSTRMPSSSA